MKRPKPGKVSLRDSVKLYIEQERGGEAAVDGRKRKNISNKGRANINSDLDDEEMVSK
jgi:hypothetical protein